MRRARAAVVWVVTAELAVLVVTGVVLFLVYRPSESWIPGQPAPDIGWVAREGRSAHRWATYLLLPTLIAAGLLHLIGRPGTRRLGGAAASLVLLLVAAAAWVSGRLIDYQAIALWATGLGGFRGGYLVVFNDEVRFVLTDQEYPRAEFARLVVAHSLGIGVAVTLGLAALWGGRARTEPGAGPAPPASPIARPG